MMETLYNHLRSYGMNDLEFIIVNSKLSHAQERVQELISRVSFEVYQETEEEEVWSLMEGGKDDMYVYDRCGRLTYYVPFPLSILTETPLVSNAILSTYFRSPCGENCDQNKTIEIEDFVKNIERDFESSNETEMDNSTYVTTEQTEFNNETNNETLSANDLFNVLDNMDRDIHISNTTDVANSTDYDYPTSSYDFSNTTSYDSDTNSTDAAKATSFFNSIYKLFFNRENVNQKAAENSNTTLNIPSTNNSEERTLNNDTEPQTHSSEHSSHSHKGHHSHHKHHHAAESDLNGRKKSDRCLEADYDVCKSYSKDRLLHAQKCCARAHLDVRNRDLRCIPFGKKRCKKIQPILKCCIKTDYTEPSTVLPSDEPTTTTSPKESSSGVTPAESTGTSHIPEVVCCRQVSDGKLCRVANTEACEEGEFVESGPNQAK